MMMSCHQSMVNKIKIILCVTAESGYKDVYFDGRRK